MKTAREILQEAGLSPPPQGQNRYYATCPRCSGQRSTAHQKTKCLGVSITGEGVKWGCNHCDFKGGAYYNGKDNDPIIAAYEYTDEGGQALFRKVRTAGKKFWQQHPDGRGGWASGINSIRRVLYRLPELIEAIATDRTVLIVEGEKDADNLCRIGIPATCNTEGASEPGQKPKWRQDYSETLRDADIVIIPDHDAAGYAHAEAIAKLSSGIAASIRILRLADYWPDCPKGGDVSDWIAAGHAREQLDGLITQAKPWAPYPEEHEHRSHDVGLISRRAADITPEKVDWLWVGRIARGKHTCIAGEPGTGKSQLSIIIVAAMTTSGEWPCGEGWASLGNVIILSAEDGAADTIVPRLMAAGADRDRVHIVSAVRNPDGKGQRTFNLQTDIELLERKIIEIGDVVMVIVDPVSSYLGKTDSHKNSEVRGVLEPLSEMAERTRVAVLTVTHFNKTGINGTTKALHRFIGSIAFTGAPRAAFAVIEDPEDVNHRLFLHAKNNLAAPPQGLGFRLEQTIVADGILGSRVVWDSEPVTITANQALAAEAAGSDQRTAKAEAMEFLTEALAGGPMPALEIMKMAREHGLTSKAVRSARETLHVKVERDGFGPGSKSLWSLPYMPNPPIDAQQSNRASMESEGIYGEQAPVADPTDAGESQVDSGDDLARNLRR